MLPGDEQMDFEEVLSSASDFLISNTEIKDSGRVTIPSRQRERYGVCVGDYVHMVVRKGDDTFPVFDAPLDSHYRVTIPKEKRELHGISVGDRVDVRVKTDTVNGR